MKNRVADSVLGALTSVRTNPVKNRRAIKKMRSLHSLQADLKRRSALLSNWSKSMITFSHLENEGPEEDIMFVHPDDASRWKDLKLGTLDVPLLPKYGFIPNSVSRQVNKPPIIDIPPIIRYRRVFIDGKEVLLLPDEEPPEQAKSQWSDMSSLHLDDEFPVDDCSNSVASLPDFDGDAGNLFQISGADSDEDDNISMSDSIGKAQKKVSYLEQISQDKLNRGLPDAQQYDDDELIYAYDDEVDSNITQAQDVNGKKEKKKGKANAALQKEKLKKLRDKLKPREDGIKVHPVLAVSCLVTYIVRRSGEGP